MVSYQVWGIPRLLKRSYLIAVFDENKWQMAQKLLAFLVDEGYKKVYIKTIEGSGVSSIDKV